MLLAYYIGAINIESSYFFRKEESQREYKPFNGIVLADTFQTGEDARDGDGSPFSENKNQIKKQATTPIKVIIGNPPYHVGQGCQNENNQNIKYPNLDKRISNTYRRLSSATNARNLYDSYIRAIRWASDRIENDGMVALVTNGNFIDTKSMDGLRASLSKEFTSIYIIDLKGDLRRGGKEAGEGILPIKVPIAISFLVKNKSKSKGVCQIHYHSIGDSLKKEEKLEKLKLIGDISGIDSWRKISPNKHNDWVRERNVDFVKYTPLEKNPSDNIAIFNLTSSGVVTSRDHWVYDFNKKNLLVNVEKTIRFYNKEVKRYKSSKTKVNVSNFVNNDKKSISWSRKMKKDLEKGRAYSYKKNCTRISVYRPFFKQWMYFDKELNESPGKLCKIFPTSECKNLVICISMDKNNFAPLMCNALPNYHTIDDSKVFPRYVYIEENGMLKKIDKYNNQSSWPI